MPPSSNLNNLTCGYPPTNKTSRVQHSKCPHFNSKQPFGSRRSPECQVAFNTLIEKPTTAPVLDFADPALPYILKLLTVTPLTYQLSWMLPAIVGWLYFLPSPSSCIIELGNTIWRLMLFPVIPVENLSQMKLNK